MEAILGIRTWDNKWKKELVKVTEKKLQIIESNSMANSRKYNIFGCRVKKIRKTKFDMDFVFKVVIENEILFFAAESNDERKKWIEFIQKYSRRDLYVSKKVRNASNSSDIRRKSICALSRDDIRSLMFDSQFLVNAYDKALSFPYSEHAQLGLAKIYAEFLSTVHHYIESRLSIDENIDKIESMNITKVDEKNRLNHLQRFESLPFMMGKRIEGIYIPMGCIVDCPNGDSYLVCFDPNVENTRISDDTIQLFNNLAMLEGCKVADVMEMQGSEDKDGRFWLFNAESFTNKLNDKYMEGFSRALDEIEIFTPEIISFIMEIEKHNIRFDKLPMLHKMVKRVESKQIIELLLICNECLLLFLRNLKNSDNYMKTALKLFTSILTDPVFFEQNIRSQIQQKYKIKTSSCEDISLYNLFVSLQYYLGVEFDDKIYTNYNEINLLKVYVVPRSSLFSICNSISPKFENLIILISEFRFKEAKESINHYLLLTQTIIGELNMHISFLMSMLSILYAMSGEDDLAKECSDSALRAGRENHLFGCMAKIHLVSPKYSFEEEEKMLRLQFNENHWIFSILYSFIVIICCKRGHHTLAESYCSRISKNDHKLCKITTSYCLSFTGKLKSDNIVICPLHSFFLAKVSQAGQEKIRNAMIAYNYYQKFPEELITIEISQFLAIQFDLINDYENAFLLYQVVLDYELTRFSDPTKEPLSIILKNIIRMFFRKMYNIDSDNVKLIKEESTKCSMTSLPEILEELISSKLYDYLSSHIKVYPLLYGYISE